VLNGVAVAAVTASVASLAGVVDSTALLPNLKGNEVITVLLSLAYLSWREDKDEMRRIRIEDKEEMREAMEEMRRIRSEDKLEMTNTRREDKQEMAAMRQNMTTTALITTFISIASAIGSVVYTYNSITVSK